MNPVARLGQASYTAVQGLDRAFGLIEKSAFEVANSPVELAFGNFEPFIQLENARVEAAANFAVLRTIGSLYDELTHLSRW
jgi:hypothetical protein